MTSSGHALLYTLGYPKGQCQILRQYAKLPGCSKQRPTMHYAHSLQRAELSPLQCTFLMGELGPHLTQCHVDRAYLRANLVLATSSIQPFDHNPTSQTEQKDGTDRFTVATKISAPEYTKTCHLQSENSKIF